MRTSMRVRRARLSRVVYSPAALSSWGRKVAWVRATFNLSYRDIGYAIGLHPTSVRKMVANPLYEPFYSDGIKFMRWYKARLRDSQMGVIVPRRANNRQ